MFYLIYVSSAVKLMEGDALQSLLEQSRDDNRRLEITGMLLYKGGNFMQMLEGEKRTVLDLYERIKKDDRHKCVVRIMMGYEANRSFDHWSMGFNHMDKCGCSQTFDDYVEENLVRRSRRKDTQDAYKFLMQVQEKVV